MSGQGGRMLETVLQLLYSYVINNFDDHLLIYLFCCGDKRSVRTSSESASIQGIDERWADPSYDNTS